MWLVPYLSASHSVLATAMRLDLRQSLSKCDRAAVLRHCLLASSFVSISTGLDGMVHKFFPGRSPIIVPLSQAFFRTSKTLPLTCHAVSWIRFTALYTVSILQESKVFRYCLFVTFTNGLRPNDKPKYPPFHTESQGTGFTTIGM